MCERHPSGSTCRPLKRDHHDCRGCCADHLRVEIGWCWVEQGQEQAGPPLALCGCED